MVRVKLTSSVGDRGSSTATSSRPFTPETDPSIEFSISPAPETAFHFRGSSPSRSTVNSADQALPSVENDTAAQSIEVSSSSGHVRTPSLSISPPPRSELSQSTPPTGNFPRLGSPAMGSAGGSIANRFGSLRLSPSPATLNMSDVAAAIENVASGADEHDPRDIPQSPDTVNQHVRPSVTPRSRKSSRAIAAPYRVQDEELPPARFHEPVVQQAIKDAKALMLDLTNVINSNSLHNDPASTMHQLHAETRDLAHFEMPPTRTVGFVGDSGVGKSSLLNSLLDLKDLARASNSGSACTCAVTEYHYHNKDEFLIDVELFSLDELFEQVTELLQAYRFYHLHVDDMDNEDDKKAAEENANVSRDTFHAMFQGRLQNELFLHVEAEDFVLETLKAWAREMRPAYLDERISKTDLESCSTFLGQLTSELSSPQTASVWPYIRKIKVFSNAHILGKGLVLADLPGLRDLNRMRRSITERYMLSCDEIFVVCNIGRALTDVGVETVFELAKQADLSNVGIVCTKSDDIRAEEAMRDWDDPRSSHIRRLLEAKANNERRKFDLDTELEELDAEIDDLLDEELRRKDDLRLRSKKFQIEIQRIVLQLKTYLIKNRNTDIMDNLHGQYANRLGDLKVFCVSNRDYWDHREKSKDKALPFLRLSGIVALRKHCLSIVADSQLRIAIDYVRNKIPVLLGKVALWVESGTGNANSTQRRTMRETLDEVERQLKMELTDRQAMIRSFAKLATHEFGVQLYNNRRIDDWGDGAREAASIWDQWHHSSYSAFCINFGTHVTKGVGSHCWNTEAIECMVTDLTTKWRNLRSLLDDNIEQITTQTEDIMDETIDRLELALSDFPSSSRTLRQTFTARNDILAADIEQRFEELEAQLSILKTDAFSGIRTSMVGQAMERSYVRCNNEYGTGSDSRRKAIIRGTLSDEDFFENMMKQFKKRFRNMMNDLQSKINDAVAAYLDDVGTTLDLIRSEHVATESESHPELRSRVDVEVQAASASIQDIQAVVAHP